MVEIPTIKNLFSKPRDRLSGFVKNFFLPIPQRNFSIAVTLKGLYFTFFKGGVHLRRVCGLSGTHLWTYHVYNIYAPY